VSEHESKLRLVPDVASMNGASTLPAPEQGTNGDGRPVPVEADDPRDRAARERDELAAQRDEHAAQRDRESALRDEEALRLDEHDRLLDRHTLRLEELRGRAAMGRRRAADDRRRAARDRQVAARDREEAARDREQAARDREQAARDREQAGIDELTGARRRGVGLEEVQREIDRVRRTDGRLTAAFVDVDDLKTVNDEQGHAAGDQVLRDVAAGLASRMRSYDLVIRLGGDEFLCVLPGVTQGETQRRFEGLAIELDEGPALRSMSFGVSQLRDGDSLGDLIDRADRDLMAARRRRRLAAPLSR
jgi:diguanylate cyclase (GGDEF)-like protein